jgi:hypothetical protein
MTVGDEAYDQVDQKVDGDVMAVMLNLTDVLSLSLMVSKMARFRKRSLPNQSS